VVDRYPRAGALLTRRLNTDLITSMWDDLLRVAASVQGGHATAALVVGKLCSSKRQQKALTSAIKEHGALRVRSTPPAIWLTRRAGAGSPGS
jgi:TnpA family transposase